MATGKKWPMQPKLIITQSIFKPEPLDFAWSLSQKLRLRGVLANLLLTEVGHCQLSQFYCIERCEIVLVYQN